MFVLVGIHCTTVDQISHVHRRDAIVPKKLRRFSSPFPPKRNKSHAERPALFDRQICYFTESVDTDPQSTHKTVLLPSSSALPKVVIPPFDLPEVLRRYVILTLSHPEITQLVICLMAH